MLTSLGFCFKEGNFYRILLSFQGQWEKTLPSLRSLKTESCLPYIIKIVSSTRLSNQSTKNQQLLLSESELLFYNFLPCCYCTKILRICETQESMNNVSCRRDITEILLKAA